MFKHCFVVLKSNKNNRDEPRYHRHSNSYKNVQIIYHCNGLKWEGVGKTGKTGKEYRIENSDTNFIHIKYCS